MKLKGYERKDGKIGFRNHVVILPSVCCTNDAAHRIGSMYNNVKVLSHSQGCAQLGEDREQSFRTLAAIGKNPNIAGVLVIGMGCGSIEAQELAHEISKSKKFVEKIVVKEEGGSIVDTITKGNKIVQHLIEETSKIKLVGCSLEDLTLGIKCGLSDITSNISANPATGKVVDKIIEAGGSTVFGETPELIGAEDILSKRAINDNVKKDLYKAIKECEEKIKDSGLDIRGNNPSPDDIKKGITSLAEKSLGAIKKAGSKPLQGVIKYGGIPRGKGLYFMYGPARTPEALTGLNAAGAQAIIFPTGGGSPAGTQISPVIKVTGNRQTAQNLREHIDVDISSVISGKETMEEAGEKLYQKLISVLQGDVTKAEAFEYGSISIWNIGAHI